MTPVKTFTRIHLTPSTKEFLRIVCGEKIENAQYRPDQQPIRIAMPYANTSFTIRCSDWFILDSATESLSKHCGHTGMPDS